MALFDNILAYYKLDSNANDSTANAKNGTSSNVSFANAGKIGNCAYHNGTSQITLPDNLGWTSTGTMSVSCWVKPVSYDDVSYILYLGETSNYTHFQLAMNANTIYYGKEKAYLGGAPTFSYTTSTSNRTHFAQTITNSVAKLYINGVYVATGTNTGNGNTAEQNGGWIDLFERYTGYVDEMAIWNKVLTDGGVSIGNTAGGEIAELYNSGAGLTYPVSTFTPYNIIF